jgi:hypothetical protein
MLPRFCPATDTAPVIINVSTVAVLKIDMSDFFCGHSPSLKGLEVALRSATKTDS